jgi:hypothetical protein
MQAATGQAVDTLVQIATHGRRDADRIRASTALLGHALRGLEEADLLHGQRKASDISPMSTDELVGILAARLRQTDQSDLTTSEKTRLTATLGNALLHAIGVDVQDKRLEALQAVLNGRKEAAKQEKKAQSKARKTP